MPLFVSTGRLRNRCISSRPARVFNYKSSEAIGDQKTILKVSIDDLTRAKQIVAWNKIDIFTPKVAGVILHTKTNRPLTSRINKQPITVNHLSMSQTARPETTTNVTNKASQRYKQLTTVELNLDLPVPFCTMHTMNHRFDKKIEKTPIKNKSGDL